MDDELIAAMRQVVKEEVSEIKKEVTGIKGNVSGITEDISGLKKDVSGITEDVSGLKKDVSGITEDISGLKKDVSGITEDISGLKKDVSSIKGQLNENTGILRALEHNSEIHKSEIDNIKLQIAKLTGNKEQIKKLKRKLKNHKHPITIKTDKAEAG